MQRHVINGLSFLTSKWPADPAKPTLIFIHAAGASASSWSLQIEDLHEIANTIAVDLPGHGKSNSTGCNKICEYAGILSEFIENSGLKTCIPVGINMGGAIAMQLLAEHSPYFSAGVLISTGAKLKVLPAFFEAIHANHKGFLANLLNFVLPPDAKSDRFTTVINEIQSVRKSIVLGDFYACNDFDIRSRLCKINKPVLIMSARKDIITPLWYGEYLKENIQNSKLVVIESAGHLANIDKSDIVNKAIADFITNLYLYN